MITRLLEGCMKYYVKNWLWGVGDCKKVMSTGMLQEGCIMYDVVIWLWAVGGCKKVKSMFLQEGCRKYDGLHL